MIDQGLYRAILADPPWAYQNWTDARNGAASSAMSCMEAEDIAAIPVAYRVSFIYPSERIAHRVMSPGGEAHAIKEPCVGTFKVLLIHDREVGVYSVAAYGATS